jgi:hypothetical protein
VTSAPHAFKQTDAFVFHPSPTCFSTLLCVDVDLELDLDGTSNGHWASRAMAIEIEMLSRISLMHREQVTKLTKTCGVGPERPDPLI